MCLLLVCFSYFIPSSVPMHKCFGKHLCMSSTFPIATLTSKQRTCSFHLCFGQICLSKTNDDNKNNNTHSAGFRLVTSALEGIQLNIFSQRSWDHLFNFHNSLVFLTFYLPCM